MEDILSKDDKRSAVNILRAIRTHRDAGPFMEAVDPVALQIPDYPMIIKRPMDFGTIGAKLNASGGEGGGEERTDVAPYSSFEEFVRDVRLVFSNCYLYNGKESEISKMAKNIEKIFDGLLSKRKPLSTTTIPGSTTAHIGGQAAGEMLMGEEKEKENGAGGGGGLRGCHTIIKELFKKQYANVAFYFYEPVDYKALNIPSYPKIIKNPMDLGTVKTKLASGAYKTPSDFHSDVLLIFTNCYKFNPPNHPVHQAGKDLEKVFNAKWAAMYPDLATSSHDVEMDKTGGASANDLSIDQKRELSVVIETLPPERLVVALEIIQSGYPEMIEEKEEIELDIDVLDKKALKKLYDYVVLDIGV
ncbi:SWR1 complex bromodomain subunit bdf1 [Zancudomyces culisetae]|uniref:SWR1 complex bromodomain subunit bdf1 n=1 Tax=Zancudomyces culisetae TaxID=1213189 RepID=A0A1R1PSE6_ZANCU|nr:SWR1 complex bromodomain subunit bdf1 [Zancudomyces culisetae]|eukprot:OMH83849.1 SWR1 complex bromodomain subunit bdf1 [Zancudomyces culisetae]